MNVPDLFDATMDLLDKQTRKQYAAVLMTYMKDVIIPWHKKRDTAIRKKRQDAIIKNRKESSKQAVQEFEARQRECPHDNVISCNEGKGRGNKIVKYDYCKQCHLIRWTNL